MNRRMKNTNDYGLVPGPIQSGLYSLRKGLNACNFGIKTCKRGILLSEYRKTKSLINCAVTIICRLRRQNIVKFYIMFSYKQIVGFLMQRIKYYFVSIYTTLCHTINFYCKFIHLSETISNCTLSPEYKRAFGKVR